jgi:hypothetical protein
MILNKSYFKSILLLVFILGCIMVYLYCKKNSTVSKSNKLNLEQINSLKKQIYVSGDTNAYNQLKIKYLEYPKEDLLFWSLYMSNKYNYKLAHTLIVEECRISRSHHIFLKTAS